MWKCRHSCCCMPVEPWYTMPALFAGLTSNYFISNILPTEGVLAVSPQRRDTFYYKHRACHGYLNHVLNNNLIASNSK